MSQLFASVRVHQQHLSSRLVARLGGRADRGDVPGWVLITLMTAGLVSVLWMVAGDRLETLFIEAIDGVTDPGARGRLRMRCSWRSRARRLADGRGREAGSAVAEFAMVSVLVLVLALGVFQLGLVLYVRNSLIAAASEGARNGARADATAADGADRTVSLITSSLSAAFAEDVSAQERTVGGARVVEVTVTAPLPVIGLIGPSGSMTVTGRAFSETQVVAG